MYKKIILILLLVFPVGFLRGSLCKAATAGTFNMVITSRSITGICIPDILSESDSVQNIDDNLPGNTNGNLANMGTLAEKNGWIYYKNYCDYDKLYRVKDDGSERQKISDDCVDCLNIVGDWVYYYASDLKGIYKVKTDGTQKEKVLAQVVQQLFVQGDTMVFSTSGGIFTAKTDGSGLIRLVNETILSISVQQGWIYYSSVNENQIGSLNKIKVDGSSLTKIADDCADSVVVSGDWIYYYSYNNGISLYKIKTDGSERAILSDDAVTSINVDGEWVYYSTIDCMYRMKLDGTASEKLSDKYYGIINIVSGNLFCYGNSITTMKTDGSNAKELESSRASEMTSNGNYLFYEGLDGVHKINAYGTEKSELSQEAAYNIFFDNNLLYYSNYKGIQKVTLDGTKRQTVIQDGTTSIVNQGEVIFYNNILDDNKLYSVYEDGSSRVKVSDDFAINVTADPQFIYYISINDKHSLKKAKVDGSKTEILIHDFVNSYIKFGSYIYYTTDDGLYRYELNSGKTELLGKGFDKVLNILDNEIYCSGVNGTYCVNLKDYSETLLCKDVFNELITFNNWLYGIDASNNNIIYKIRFDGTGLSKLSYDNNGNDFYNFN